MAQGINSPPPSSSRETVSVASRLPFPLILRTFDMVPKWDDGGKREIKVPQQRPETFTINGLGTPPKTRREDQAQIIGGYVITHNVPIDIWKAWFEDNKRSDFIVNKLVFANEKPADVEDRAKNNGKAARSGLEPLNPEKIIRNGQRVPADPRIPHVIDPNDGPLIA
jgi:hypothetical protein